MVIKKEGMVMDWLFYLDDIEIEEPEGFENIELSITRDDKLHGIGFEASTSPLQFYGDAFVYLKNKKETEGVKANVIFKAFVTCDTYDYEEVLSGRLNFGKYKEICGTECGCSLPWENESCEVVLKSRYDQKVDLDKTTAADGITSLEPYAGLAMETELQAVELQTGIDANVHDDGYEIHTGNDSFTGLRGFAFRPMYSVVRLNNISTGNIESGVDMAADPPFSIYGGSISPQLLFEDEIGCFDGNFEYNFRLKGTIDIDGSSINVILARARLSKGEWPDSVTDIQVQNLSLVFDQPFDVTFSGTTTLNNGEGLYMLLEFGIDAFGTGNIDFNIVFDKESSAEVIAKKSCPATTADVYMVHETLSRVTESITNGCIRVKSSYYGRVDSEPFSFDDDGCGGLRSVTSGLKIRRAEDDKFFASAKELIEGLQAIDNIGMEVQNNVDISGRGLLVIEDLDYFYQDKEILRHDYIPKGTTDTEEMKHYSKVLVGYKKWEVEEVNGLDEFNSNRQYATSIDTIESTLDITSNLVAGSYPIEITRQQSFASTGAADTKYDNETFILCMRRNDYPVYNQLLPEQGNITNAQNIFSPGTIYNYRLSPLRNLMRWYRSIAPGWVDQNDSTNKLYFASGTGNLTASGMMTDPNCRLELIDIQENQNLFVTHFADQSKATPLWKNELITYEYPMSIADYKAIKADKYGYISAQCGNGEYLKYWIKEIKFKMVKGSATFILRRKYEL